MIGQHQPSPAVAALKNILRQKVPFLTSSYPYLDRQDGQMKSMTRLQHGAGHGQTSHLAGLALDIFLDRHSRRLQSLAHHLIVVLITHAAQMRWSQIIYERSNFIRHGGSVRYHAYTHDQRHHNHIHIDWWRGNAVQNDVVTIPVQARNNSFAGLMQTDLEKLYASWTHEELSPLDLTVDPLAISRSQSIVR